MQTKNLRIFAQSKRSGRKIVMLTAYDLTSALIAREGSVDALLVGDSLGMVVLGHENTLPVTIEDMVHHCAAVTRSRPGLPIIADMPYGSFHVSASETVRHAIRLVKEGGASAVKVEGGRSRETVIRALLAAEIPVMGHIGLTPQSIHKLGGFKVQGRGRGAADLVLDEAIFLEEVGCFAIVVECVPSVLARRITEQVTIPTIGIGAGPDCDGQILVFHDLLGLFEGIRPKFVKRYAELGEQAVDAVRRYSDEVRNGEFPAEEHCFSDKHPYAPATRSEAEPTHSPQPEAETERGYLTSCDTDEQGLPWN
ncbi:3-methyl-2-oxobutanoate hydroxymethyltransferase [bacterium]|nr:3-methyl-2-oxobutanoate hydroxymethyltransferase [bacterium]